MEFPPGTAASPGDRVGQLASCSLAMVWIGVEIRSFGGYCRYVGLGILGGESHSLGKAVDRGRSRSARAGQSRRGRTAA